jgi:hypothetical protein
VKGKNGKYDFANREIVRLSPVSDGYLQKYRLRGDFSQIPLPNMTYLFNYTEYYLEHWLNK